MLGWPMLCRMTGSSMPEKSNCRRRTAADVRDVMIEGESGLLSVCADWDRPLYEPSKRRVTFKNGSICTAYSTEESDRLRGPQHDAAWCDELAAWANVRETWDMLQFGMRLGKKPPILVTSTPRPIKLLKELLARAMCMSPKAGRPTTPRICRRHFLLRS
jgi:phage terminase large subunit-like protein